MGGFVALGGAGACGGKTALDVPWPDAGSGSSSGSRSASLMTDFLCMWDAAAGQAYVPQPMLAPLAGQSGGYLYWGQATTTTFTAGPYTIGEHALPCGLAQASFQ